MYSNYADPGTAHFEADLGNTSVMSLEQLVPALLDAIDKLSKYPRPKTSPEIHRVARETIEALACVGRCGVRAIFHPGQGIFIDERMQPETSLFDRSVLLHELVHYVQELANERGEMEPCKRWYFRELEAYAIQKQFLTLIGSPVRVGYSGGRSACDDSTGSSAAESLYER
jgi:hypothetical protein